jgi:hypothetical protein
MLNILNKGNSFALSEPELAAHENPSRRITKGLPLSSYLFIDMSYVIHPKYIHTFLTMLLMFSSNFSMTGHILPWYMEGWVR